MYLEPHRWEHIRLYIWSLESPQRALTAPFRASPLCSVTFKLNSCYNILISLTHTQFVIAVLLRNMHIVKEKHFDFLARVGFILVNTAVSHSVISSVLYLTEANCLCSVNETMNYWDQSTMRLISEWKLSA